MTQELLNGVKNRERKAQYEFYRQFSVRIFRLVYRYVSNEQDAGSIVNTAFYKIFNNIGEFSYRDEVSMLAWMKRIAVNEALMFLRQRVHYSEINEELLKDIPADAVIEDNLLLEDYYKMIMRLPDDLRTVFNLYALEGFNHNEISVQLKISESSSRVYLMRARKLLQKYLTKN